MPGHVDQRALRHALSRFGTGVCVVTYEGAAAVRGITVNSFTSVSLHPPLVLVSISHGANAWRGLYRQPFTVNVLAVEQVDVALLFGGQRHAEPEVAMVPGAVSPRLAGCVAWVDCEPWKQIPVGDHDLVIGRVATFDTADGDPLIFASGAFWELGAVIARTRIGPVPRSLAAPSLQPAHAREEE